MEGVKIDKGQPSRCPFCHEDVLVGSIVVCECLAKYHGSCALELDKCASCGSAACFSGNPQATITPEVIERLIAVVTASGLWNEAYDIVRSNVQGKVWLVGGKVYRTLTEILFNQTAGALQCDYDFITAKTTWRNHVPDRWLVTEKDDYGSSTRNPYTSEKLEHAWRYSRDRQPIFDLMTFNRATQAGYEPNLDGYFKSVPLDVQAIALDIEDRVLLGHGALAVCRKTVRVNNPVEAQYAANRAKLSLYHFVEGKARSLGFRADVAPPTFKLTEGGK